MNHPSDPQLDHDLQEANSCLAIGAGVGVMGTGSALLIGATCPLCVVVAPALIGMGLWKRYSAQRISARRLCEQRLSEQRLSSQRQAEVRPEGSTNPPAKS